MVGAANPLSGQYIAVHRRFNINNGFSNAE